MVSGVLPWTGFALIPKTELKESSLGVNFQIVKISLTVYLKVVFKAPFYSFFLFMIYLNQHKVSISTFLLMIQAFLCHMKNGNS